MNESLLMPLVALAVGAGVVSSLFLGGHIPGTYPYLSRQVRSLSKQERLSALIGLGRLGGEKATNLLITMLNHPELDMRRVAIESLARTGAPAALEPLGTLLDDASPSLRRTAAMGLAAFKHPRATELLCQALKDPDEQVVTAAALALAQRQDPATIEPLCRALTSSAEIARVVMKALEKFGMEAFDTLCRLLPEAGPVSSERIIEVMRAINPEASVDPLMQTLSHGRLEATVRAAIRALTALNPPGLVDRLSQLLRNPQALGRAEAITALRELNHPQGIAAIAHVLSDPDPELRRTAVMALNGQTDPAVIEALCKALSDEDWEVVRLAAQSLGQVRDRRILRTFFLALYPLDGESAIQAVEGALMRPLEDLDSALDFLPVLERWAGSSSRQDDPTARHYMQSALILLHGRIVRGFRDIFSTVLIFRGLEWSSPTQENCLHPLAVSALEFLRSTREVRQFQNLKLSV